MTEMSERIIFFKKHKTENADYYYYVTKKGNDYYICEEAIYHEQVTPTWVVNRGEGKECLKLQDEREAKEIIALLKKGKYEKFDEDYGNRNWIESE